MTTPTLFPQRQRCQTCRKGLGRRSDDPVYDGLYCSARCAGIAEPGRSATVVPRECRTQNNGGWSLKRRYRSESEIPDKLRSDPSTSWYWCSHCHHLHIGHTRMGNPESFRGLRQIDDLRDVLIKRRGRASRKQVAEVAGVRPIRLKELEEGIDHPQGLETLFKVCAALRLDIGVSIR